MAVFSYITYISIALIIGVFVYFCFFIKRTISTNTFRENQNFIEHMPSALSTLGVLGTFVGITFGLLYFDTTDISSSISLLLDGLKTAFYTSITGMVSSMIINRWISSFSDKMELIVPSNEQEALKRICTVVESLKDGQTQLNVNLENAAANNSLFQKNMLTLLEKHIETLDLLVSYQANIKTQLENQSKTSYDLFQKSAVIQDSLINIHKVSSSIQTEFNSASKQLGEILDAMTSQVSIQEESLQQTKNLSEIVRGEIVSITDSMEKGNKLMERKFDEFSELMQKNNVEALVEVMKKVTEEFNKSMKELINKLVKENFEELNRSVGRLNTWQHENKSMIQELTKQYGAMTNEFSSTSVILNDVAQNTKLLISSDGQLQRLINELQKVLIDDTKFAEITNKLNEVVGKVHEGTATFEESTKELNQWIRNHRDIGDGVRLLINKLDEINKIKDYNDQFWQGTKKSLNEGVEVIASASKELNGSVSTLNAEFYERLNNTLANLDACIQAMYQNRRAS